MARVSTPLFRMELTVRQRQQIQRVLGVEAAALELSLPDLKNLCTRAQPAGDRPAVTAPRAARLQLRLTREHPAVLPAAHRRPH